MLNCIMATILPNSGRKRPKTPASFMARRMVSGSPDSVRQSRNSALASSFLRSLSPMWRRLRRMLFNASGWISLPSVPEDLKMRMRLTGSLPKAFSSARPMRPASILKSSGSPVTRLPLGRNLPIMRESDGASFKCLASRLAQKIRVRLPTSLATKK